MTGTPHVEAPHVEALPDGGYEVSLTAGDRTHLLLATVTGGDGIETVSFEPDPFSSGELADPRPVVAAVLAAHHGTFRAAEVDPGAAGP